MTTTVKPEEKRVQVISRNEFLHIDRVEYTVLSHDRKKKYTTTLVNGEFDGCTCPAAWGACYHGKQLVELEADLRNTEKERDQLLADIERYRREAELERDRLLAELVQYQADQEAAKMAADQDDISTTGENDPWFGLTSAQRFQAWRDYEAGLAGLAS